LRCAKDGKCSAAEIRNISTGAIKLWSRETVTAGSAVEIEFGPGFREMGTVFYCRRDDDGYSIVVTLDPMKGERREVREMLLASGSVTELGGGPNRVQPARALDISKSGLGILVKKPLPVGSLVSVMLPDRIFLGEVRNCSLSQGGQFRVGLSIEREMPRLTTKQTASPRSATFSANSDDASTEMKFPWMNGVRSLGQKLMRVLAH
jgi:hypothetical protein